MLTIRGKRRKVRVRTRGHRRTCMRRHRGGAGCADCMHEPTGLASLIFALLLCWSVCTCVHILFQLNVRRSLQSRRFSFPTAVATSARSTVKASHTAAEPNCALMEAKKPMASGATASCTDGASRPASAETYTRATSSEVIGTAWVRTRGPVGPCLRANGPMASAEAWVFTGTRPGKLTNVGAGPTISWLSHVPFLAARFRSVRVCLPMVRPQRCSCIALQQQHHR